ncbi:hypothetical protein ACT009_10915 [Sphingomonas sp. Tas61C01]|uniref:hypothetical protein n=1 Tax=Sphingomonas sp. Tas61C01 TaxID=3458297 RepID=UPI00403E6705
MRIMVGALMAMVAGQSAADAQGRRGEEPVDAVVACRTERDDKARLACFDRTSATIASARQSGDLIVLNRAKVVDRRRRSFGLPSANALAVADVRGATVKELSGVVRAVSLTRTPGRYVFELTDNSAWEMLEPSAPPSAKEAVNITAVRLGGFRAKIGRGRAVMVKRVR